MFIWGYHCLEAPMGYFNEACESIQLCIFLSRTYYHILVLNNNQVQNCSFFPLLLFFPHLLLALFFSSFVLRFCQAVFSNSLFDDCSTTIKIKTRKKGDTEDRKNKKAKSRKKEEQKTDKISFRIFDN